MKINLDYKAKEKELGNKTPQTLTYDYLSFAVNQKYKDGLEGQKGRLWGRLQRKFDEAVEAKAEDVELEEAEKDFVKESVKDAKYPPQIQKFVMVLRDEVEKL